jgi:hypothetical protein
MAIYFEISSELNSWSYNSDFKNLGFSTYFISTEEAISKMDLTKNAKYWSDISLALGSL